MATPALGPPSTTPPIPPLSPPSPPTTVTLWRIVDDSLPDDGTLFNNVGCTTNFFNLGYLEEHSIKFKHIPSLDEIKGGNFSLIVLLGPISPPDHQIIHNESPVVSRYKETIRMITSTSILAIHVKSAKEIEETKTYSNTNYGQLRDDVVV